MGSYLDTSWADLRALTRERRIEAACRRDDARIAHESLSFPFVAQNVQQDVEAAWRDHEMVCGPVHLQWKRQQWQAGNRRCASCWTPMTRDPNRINTCTVDHRHPRALGGRDEPANYAMCCSLCNNLKGIMTEREFVALPQAPMRGQIAHQLHGTRPGL